MSGAPPRSHRDHEPAIGSFRTRPLTWRERWAFPWNSYPRWVPELLVQWLDDAADRRTRLDRGLIPWLMRGIDRLVELVLAAVAAGALVVVVQVAILLARWLS